MTDAADATFNHLTLVRKCSRDGDLSRAALSGTTNVDGLRTGSVRAADEKTEGGFIG